MNTPEHCGDETINKIWERHETCTYPTCQWPNCLCANALMHDQETVRIAQMRSEIRKALEALAKLEQYLKDNP